MQPDWTFENRPVDLITEGFGGFELSPGVVARTLAPAHIVAVASPAYLQGRPSPRHPADLAELDGVLMRSARTGRIRLWALANAAGEEAPAALRPRLVVNDPEAVCRGALLGLGVGLAAIPDVLAHLESGALVRVLPEWFVDAGPISLYFASQRLLPAKTRAFVGFVSDHFRAQDLARRLSAA